MRVSFSLLCASHQSRIIIVPSVPSAIFPPRAFLFSSFSFSFSLEGGSTGAPRLLKAFRIHDSQKLNWNCSNRSPVSSFARISRVLLLVLFHTLQFHRVLRLIIFAALFPSITCLDRSIDRWDMQNNKIIGIFL